MICSWGSPRGSCVEPAPHPLIRPLVSQGAEDVLDLKEEAYAQQLAEALKLPPMKARKLVNGITTME